MTEIKRNTIVVGVSILQKHQDYIDRLMEDKSFMSRSDVHRRAIEMFYEKFSRTHPSGLKEKNLIEKENFKKMTDEVYALNVLKAVILPNKDGIPFVVMHWFGNALGAKPLAGCKEWFSARLDIVENHLMLSRKTPIEEAVLDPGNKDTLLRNYGITVPDEQTNPADTELPVS